MKVAVQNGSTIMQEVIVYIFNACRRFTVYILDLDCVNRIKP